MNLKPQIENQLSLAQQIYSVLFQFKRKGIAQNACQGIDCPFCMNPHLDKIEKFVNQNKKIKLILPAFPGKSPNPNKVLSHLPDMAEKLALTFLNELCLQVQEIYSPGMELIICSDGRVFSDVVGINETLLTEYQIEIAQIIVKFSLSNLKTFNLDDVFHETSFAEMRSRLMEKFGKSLNHLKDQISNGKNIHSTIEEQQLNYMYRGITRFLYEDSIGIDKNISNSQLQKRARKNSYEVILRSNAWSDLLEEIYPDAIRLSIHPQVCGSKKMGIRLIADESWITPWHGVAVETKDGFFLFKKSQAEKMGARLVMGVRNRPSHYELRS